MLENDDNNYKIEGHDVMTARALLDAIFSLIKAPANTPEQRKVIENGLDVIEAAVKTD